MTPAMEELYRDQGGIISWPISTFYTPMGVQKIDCRFCNRIHAFSEGKKCVEYAWHYGNPYSDGLNRVPRKEVENEWIDTYESLKKDIEENPHLHPKIKENLLYNLNNANQMGKPHQTDEAVSVHSFTP